MNKESGLKSSSRGGRFKKKLVSEQDLQSEAPVIEVKMAPILLAFEEKKISEAELVTIYLLLVLSHRYPGHWLGAKASAPPTAHLLLYPLKNLLDQFEPNIQKRLGGFATVGDVLNSFALKSTPQSVNRSLLNWSTGLYQLVLMLRIPTPSEVLQQQCQGKRCVTLLTQERSTRKYILGERDALGFTLHDLIHADHFYHDNDLFQGQVDFYKLMNRSLCAGSFKEHFEEEEFVREFEYLIADMNAYPIHLLKCFKAAMIHYHPAGASIYESWVRSITADPETQEAFNSLNTPTPSQDSVILGFLKRQSP
jgi:hypothetical protein